ncbi:MAG TPA: thiamine pyrophosphate-dependent enzyme, partial [Candidatus Angelobacter sp.]|nr:thiamine pyrophosphate-dependent enzyme [Candidatus Angelobacter sp.]
MGQKNKTRSASAPARKTKSSKLKTRPAPRKAPAKKAKPDEAALAVLNADKLKQLYATMLKCRMLTERMGGIVDSGSNPAHILPGLEAMLVGAGAHLQPQDSIALEHGGFLARLIKGTPLRVILAQMNEPQKSNGIQQTSTNDGTATSHTMMTGLALAQEMKGKGAVTLMFATNNSSTSDFE